MRKVILEELIEGMIIADDVHNKRGQMIMPKGIVLNDSLISKLTYYSVEEVFIEDTLSPSSEPVKPEDTQVPAYIDRMRKDPEFKKYQQQYGIALEEFKSQINEIVARNRINDVEALFTPAIYNVLIGQKAYPILDLLANMHKYDDATYSHSINVALISNVLAGWIGMTKEEIRLATLCGLFHDVGKLLIPDEIIKKPGQLTKEEFNRIKEHSEKGYALLKSCNVDVHIQNAAYMHHEKCDGSGYPQGLMRDAIDEYAKIIAIADVYDAMTSPRVYRGPLCPFKVIEIFEEEGLQKYEVGYIQTFLQHVVNTYLLANVQLSDGRSGQIVYVNQNHLSRPVVRCGDEFLDLQKGDIRIEELL